MFNVSLILLGIAVLLLALATWSFRVRAISNQKAWGGNTVLFAASGAIMFVISLVMLYLNYPR